jgi:Tfp pilus assembly protein PilX
VPAAYTSTRTIAVSVSCIQVPARISQVEIDEYRDYEKALSALREALKYMVKARSQHKDERCRQLQQKIYLVDRFVEARKVVKVCQKARLRFHTAHTHLCISG